MIKTTTITMTNLTTTSMKIHPISIGSAPAGIGAITFIMRMITGTTIVEIMEIGGVVNTVGKDLGIKIQALQDNLDLEVMGKTKGQVLEDMVEPK
jgi:hypothetical protein